MNSAKSRCSPGGAVLLISLLAISPHARCQTVPNIASVTNGASYSTRTSSIRLGSDPQIGIAPGEVISILGTGLGPTVPMGPQLDSTGKVATQLAGVQVLFNVSPCGPGISGCPATTYQAPLTYVSQNQINCVVPYELNGSYPATYTLTVQVSSGGQLSAPFAFGGVYRYAPGIFTATGAGTGQAAALNQDGTPNGPQNPALPGSIVAIYMTGEGPPYPAGVDGAVTCSSGCASTRQIPKPNEPPIALVGELTMEEGSSLPWENEVESR